jgi:ubiquinone/menaquinone biosynthesis C-methylase UbiE
VDGRGKKRLKEYPNVDFKLGDIASLDIPDDAYDVVVVHFVLHHVDGDARQKNVSILSRKLKKGGRLFIRDPIREGLGTPVYEVKQLMSNVGLHGRAFQMEKSFLWAFDITVRSLRTNVTINRC